MIRTTTQRMIHVDLFTILQGVFNTAWTWNERFRQRLALGNLDPRLQRDVGLTPGKATLEAAKPFWLA